MARRKNENLEDSIKLPIAALLLLGALVILAKENPIGVIIMLGLPVGGYCLYRRHKRERLYDRLAVEMKRHEAALIAYFRQSISEDAFGNIDDRQWQKHIETFLRTQVVPDVANYSGWRNSRLGCEAASVVHYYTLQQDSLKREQNPLSAIEAYELSPSEYEQLCADILNRLGWAARVTQSTRDHGADVIAEKHGIRAVIQCKRYSQPVGNKAVQEAHSALRLYAGTVACVVAPAGFTTQAKREANGLAVKLLHHSELETLDRQLGMTSYRIEAIRQRAIAH